MDFKKDFDELLAAILTDWRNQFPEADTSQGSLIFLKSACLASALWGLYKYQEWIAKQIFPDTADVEALEHHAWVRGLARTSGETDSAYLARLLEYIRRPPAGGNKYDYEKWALEIDNVAAAYCIPLAQGLGTVDVIIMANIETTESEVPSSSSRQGSATSVLANKLVDSAADFTAAAHPVAAGDIVVNTAKGTQTTVVTVDSGTELTLDADIFEFVGENYLVFCHTGTNTSVSADKLVDTAAQFDDAVYTVGIGDLVQNIDAGTESTVVSIDSATQITLAEDIFTAEGAKYVIKSLTALVKTYIDSVRPVTASIVRILPPTIVTQGITMTVTGVGANKIQIAADIEGYLNSLIPGQTLYISQLLTIAVENGAENAAISVPAADVEADSDEMIRPGVISVT